MARNSPAGNYHDAKAMIPIQYKIIQRFVQRDPTVDHQDPDAAEKLRKALFTSVNSKTSQIDVTGPIPIIQDITAPDTFIELTTPDGVYYKSHGVYYKSPRRRKPSPRST